MPVTIQYSSEGAHAEVTAGPPVSGHVNLFEMLEDDGSFARTESLAVPAYLAPTPDGGYIIDALLPPKDLEIGFSITSPWGKPLEDWGLAIHGFQHVFDRLKLDKLAELFGITAVKGLIKVQELTADAWPGLEEYNRRKHAKGPRTLGEAFQESEDQYRALTLPCAEDINATTAAHRSSLLLYGYPTVRRHPVYTNPDSGRFVLSPTVLLKDE